MDPNNLRVILVKNYFYELKNSLNNKHEILLYKQSHRPEPNLFREVYAETYQPGAMEVTGMHVKTEEFTDHDEHDTDELAELERK